MQSKISCFNPAIYRKNLTRFAPVWLLYTLGLVLMVFLGYNNTGRATAYQFAYDYATLAPAMAFIHLGYALLTAQLLFGDLFNSRMCHALHAMPVRREGLFLTNLLSGLTVSILPTAIMTALALMLVRGSVFTNAVQMVGLVFLAANLEFICFFGMAVFAVMCTGNRFTMAAGYGLLNFGAYISYFLVDTLYTPLLYGVVTPTSLASKLTPMEQMWNGGYITAQGKHRGVLDESGNLIPGMTDSFAFANWWQLFLLAGVGLAFAAAALVLYRKRNLECAGDAVAFKCLTPVFQVPCAIVVAAALFFLTENIFGLSSRNANSYLMLAIGLAVGWFTGKMLTYRSTRVFQLKNWMQLGILAAVIAVTLLATKLDILGIEDRQPKLEDIAEVKFGTGYTSDTAYTDPADIEAILRLQRLAVEDQVKESGSYILENGEPILVNQVTVIDRQEPSEEIFYASDIHILYTLKNGSTMNRRYRIWSDQEEGDIVRNLLSRWELVNRKLTDVQGKKVEVLDLILHDFGYIDINRAMEEQLSRYQTVEDARSLVAAIQADCAAGAMAQDPFLHNGHFRYPDAKYESGYYNRKYIYLSINNQEWNWNAEIFPECTNTLRWMEDRGLLNYEISPLNIPY